MGPIRTAVVFLLSIAPAAAQDAEVARWLAALSDERPEIREQAHRKLLERGRSILPELKPMLAQRDPELRGRAQELWNDLHPLVELQRLWAELTQAWKKNSVPPKEEAFGKAMERAVAFGDLEAEYAHGLLWTVQNRIRHLMDGEPGASGIPSMMAWKHAKEFEQLIAAVAEERDDVAAENALEAHFKQAGWDGALCYSQAPVQRRRYYSVLLCLCRPLDAAWAASPRPRPVPIASAEGVEVIFKATGKRPRADHLNTPDAAVARATWTCKGAAPAAVEIPAGTVLESPDGKVRVLLGDRSEVRLPEIGAVALRGFYLTRTLPRAGQVLSVGATRESDRGALRIIRSVYEGGGGDLDALQFALWVREAELASDPAQKLSIEDADRYVYPDARPEDPQYAKTYVADFWRRVQHLIRPKSEERK